MNEEPVVYRCTAKPEVCRLLFCYPIADGKATVYCSCGAPYSIAALTGKLVERLHYQSYREGQNSVLACLDPRRDADVIAIFKERK